MRANAQRRVEFDDTSIDGFVSLLDDFAALPARAPARRARGSHSRPQARRAVSNKPLTAPALARTRASIAGLLLTLLAGGLGFAIWTGPQSCLGCDDALVVAPSAQASNRATPASRFEYTALADLDQMLKLQPSQSAHDWSDPSRGAQVRDAKPPVLAAAKGEDNITPLPMTTSATGRLYEPQSLIEAKPPRHSHPLPAVAAEVSDVEPKPLKLTAATEISEEITSPPSVLAVERSPVNELAAIDIPVRKPKTSRTKRPQVQSQRPRGTARARKKVKATQSNTHIPSWARKMYGGNWQDRAFLYQSQ